MIEISNTLKEWLRTIPIGILHELWAITQEIPYEYIEEEGLDKMYWSINWRKCDALSQEISTTMRERNNPE